MLGAVSHGEGPPDTALAQRTITASDLTSLTYLVRIDPLDEGGLFVRG